MLVKKNPQPYPTAASAPQTAPHIRHCHFCLPVPLLPPSSFHLYKSWTTVNKNSSISSLTVSRVSSAMSPTSEGMKIIIISGKAKFPKGGRTGCLQPNRNTESAQKYKMLKRSLLSVLTAQLVIRGCGMQAVLRCVSRSFCHPSLTRHDVIHFYRDLIYTFCTNCAPSAVSSHWTVNPVQSSLITTLLL